MAVVELLNSPQYAHAPITEAVIHFAIEGSVSVAEQEKIANQLKKHYTRSQPQAQFTFAIDTVAGKIGVDQRPEGFRLSSDDQTDIVLLQPAGLVISRLAPYPGWEDFKARAISVFSDWRKIAGFKRINRIGLRYINRLDIPRAGREFIVPKEYLNVYPHVPTLGGDMTGYVTQITMPASTPPWNCSITSTVVLPPPLIDHLSLLLDIDVFCQDEIPVKSEDIWAAVDIARLVKNDIFERCITQATRDLIS